MRHILLLFILPLVTITIYGTPQDRQADNVRRIPPAGIKISDSDRAELTKDVAAMEQEIKDARKELQGQPRLLDLFPDVMIFHKAVDWALKYDEFYEAREVKAARELLKSGRERLSQIKSKKPEYISECGLVVRGYLSKIDGSVQPYGLVVPESYTPKTLSKYRLDVWLHGRGEKLTELAFIDQRSRQPGEFTPQDAFVLHPYGRYCNAFKFAGEVDVFEALEHCKKHYRIDEKRLVVRGFSMGGAGCWHLAVHHPDKWCAAAPGAGFAETAEFANIASDPVPPTWWEKKLWNWYDATSYAENLKNLPTVAYSGEIDKQKQAADVMAREMKKFGMTLRHVIGPKTGHSYHPEARKEINRRIDGKASEEYLSENRWAINHTTYTTRYSSNRWITINQMDEQWKRAHVEAFGAFFDYKKDRHICIIKTIGVSSFTIDMNPSLASNYNRDDNIIEIDGQPVQIVRYESDGWITAHFRKDNGKWKLIETLDDGKLRKKPGLQGPIDDAFMDSFLIVKPSDKSPHAKVNEWVDAEMNRAIDQWRKQFRGIPRVKMDKEVTDADINNHNLILWGLPASNSVLKKIVGKLPIRWADGKLHVDDKSYDADTHTPILIYPNPLNPSKYIVLNSGHTFREESNRSNARQTPKLPDWAIVDITTSPNSYHPGKVVDAGFFGEQWEWKKQEAR